MLEQERLVDVQVRLLIGQREEICIADLEMNLAGEIHINELVNTLKNNYQIEQHAALYFYDHSLTAYQPIQEDKPTWVPLNSLLPENVITFKCQARLSDEVLANPAQLEQDTRTKRSPQRVIEEAFYLTEQWRLLYRQGLVDNNGKRRRVNLDQAADFLGVNRKTMEDYYLLFRAGKSLEFDFKTSRYEKIGRLRSYIRSKGKVNVMGSKNLDEEQFFKELRFQMTGVKPEQELFDILGSSGGEGSSDEDMIPEN